MKNIKVEAEGGELLLQNDTGDVAIIPKKYRLEVMGMIEDGCFECIDNLVSTLPTMEDYAQDGTVLPIKVNQPDGTIKEYDRFSQEYRELYNSGNLTNYDAKRDEYVATPLKEVEVTATKPKSVGDFFEKYSDRMREEYGSSLAGSLIGVPSMGVLGLPQAAMTYMLDKDKNTLPSKALDIENSVGAFAVDALADPLAGAGIAKGAKSLAKALFSRIIKPKIASSVDDVVKNTTQTPKADKPAWQMQELPGLHLKSTMEGEAISKIVEPKTGLINIEQALAIIGKESGGSDKVALIRQGLGDNMPKKMDYNKFRKVVQDQLIPLERQFATGRSDYGLDAIGYYGKPFLDEYNNVYRVSGAKDLSFKTQEEAMSFISKNKPLENQTLILGNKGRFGRGSSAHGNPDETLGHAHFLRDAESPDVLTVTQIQSDAFQGTHRSMRSQNSEINRWKEMLTPEGKKQLIEIGGEEAAESAQKAAKEFLEKAEKEAVEALGPNPIQKQLLDKNHQERYLQEIVDYAGKRGDVNKVRVPTSETAAKVQGYSKIELTGDNTPGFVELQEKISIAVRQGNQKEVDELMKIHDKMLDTPYKKYSNEHQTILKKYSEQPKTIKKLFGKEPTVVTDSKGNTWYEFDIPEKFKEGKGEIKAFNFIPPAVGVGVASQLINDKNQE